MGLRVHRAMGFSDAAPKKYRGLRPSPATKMPGSGLASRKQAMAHCNPRMIFTT